LLKASFKKASCSASPAVKLLEVVIKFNSWACSISFEDYFPTSSFDNSAIGFSNKAMF
jgi:hypothetical protein